MRIGILTLPRAINDGAVMQAYCLQRLLQSRLPHARVEIIDYHTQTIARKERRQLFKRAFPFFNHPAWQKQRGLRQFLSENADLSLESLVSDNLEECRAFVARQNYDAIFVGSDVIWQVNSGRAIPLPPTIYHLPELDNLKKIAFAASADLSDPNLWHHNAQQVRRHLSQFDYITVRDQTTQHYLTKIVGLRCPIEYMPDPAILWDFSPMLEIPEHLRQGNGKLAGVAVSGIRRRQQLTHQLQQSGYRVINLLGVKTEGQLAPPVRNLRQRIGLFAILDFIVSDRFHSSIFTLKLSQAPAVFVESGKKYPERNISKGRDLFQRLGIARMVWRDDSEEGLPSDLVNQYLERWKILDVDLAARFSHLQEEAEPTLQRIFANLT